jgi:ribosomal-protein-alanine N-acetyltransferase
MNPPRTLETERLRLRPPALDDAQAIFGEYAQDPQVTRYLTWRPHDSVETTRTFLRRCVQSWERRSPG